MGRRPGPQDPARQGPPGRGPNPPPRHDLPLLRPRARQRRRIRPLPREQAGLPRLRHRAEERPAHRHRDHRGCLQAHRKDRMDITGARWGLRGLPALPPPPRARTHPPREIPRDLRPRSVTSSQARARSSASRTRPRCIRSEKKHAPESRSLGAATASRLQGALRA
jgi:hypothetical protein